MHPLLQKYFFILKTKYKTILQAIVIDQITKWWMIGFLKTKAGYFYKVFPGMNFIIAWNYGISFGMFSSYYQYSNIFFLVINILIVLYLFHLMLEAKTFQALSGYSLIIGGAIGNLIDRVMRGAVFDFIDLYYRDMHFATFNLADSFITIGAIFIIYDFFFRRKIEENADEEYNLLKKEADKIRKMDSEIAKTLGPKSVKRKF